MLRRIRDLRGRAASLTALASVVTAAVAVTSTPAMAAGAQSCERLHVTYGALVVGVAYPASVYSSSCSIGAGLPVSSTGSGSVTNDGFGGPLACAAFQGCDHFDLTITVGATTIHPVFELGVQVVGVGSAVIVSTSVGPVETGPIIAFSSGTGSGALAATCTYDAVNGVDNCTADGWFTWVG